MHFYITQRTKQGEAQTLQPLEPNICSRNANSRDQKGHWDWMINYWFSYDLLGKDAYKLVDAKRRLLSFQISNFPSMPKNQLELWCTYILSVLFHIHITFSNIYQKMIRKICEVFLFSKLDKFHKLQVVV